MKAVTVDNEIYLVMNRLEAQAVAAACDAISQDWEKGNPVAQKWAYMAKRAVDELKLIILSTNTEGKKL